MKKSEVELLGAFEKQRKIGFSENLKLSSVLKNIKILKPDAYLFWNYRKK